MPKPLITYTLRVSPELAERIERQSDGNKNALIVRILDENLED